MSAFAEELCHHATEIVHRWYEAWRRSDRRQLAETPLKDSLAHQLILIGEQLSSPSGPKEPTEMWQSSGDLAPEQRVVQDMPIEEMVQEYALLVDIVRDWLEEREVEVTFREYTYYHRALLELVAEAVRRYATRQAEEVAADRREYVAGIAHQLRTPLSTLAMQIDLLEHSGEPLDEHTKSLLRRNLKRLQRLVGSVMRVERYAPGDIPLHPHSMRASDLVSQVLEDHEPEARRKGLRLDGQTDPALELHLDEDLLLDALSNIVDNAVKYTKEGFVRVTVRSEDDCATFEVADSGPGIPADQRDRLFTPAKPGGRDGAGLGLSIACRAVVAQGGHIDVESELGKGSVFRFRLPKEVAPRDEPGHEEGYSG